MPWRPTRRSPRTSPRLSEAFTAEAALQWYALRMASVLTSLDAVYFEEEGFDDAQMVEEWAVSGWYRVEQQLLVHGGERELVGTLSMYTAE